MITIGLMCACIFANAQCSELFISEYVEGAGNNKAMEIYNPSLNPINLSAYRIVRYSNGSSVPSDSFQLSGTINPGQAWVVVNGQTVNQQNSPACDTALQALANQLGGAYPDPMYMNGDDAVCLVKVGTTRVIIDIFGKIGEDPGTCWTDVFPYTDIAGAYWTKDHTMQRKATVMQGVMVNPSAFNPTLEYDSLPEGTWTGLGTHTCNCPTGINEFATNVQLSIFPNPSANGMVYINASASITQIQIINTLGAIVDVITVANQTKNTIVNTSAYTKGLYTIKVIFGTSGFLTNKITVQ